MITRTREEFTTFNKENPIWMRWEWKGKERLWIWEFDSADYIAKEEKGKIYLFIVVNPDEDSGYLDANNKEISRADFCLI